MKYLFHLSKTHINFFSVLYRDLWFTWTPKFQIQLVVEWGYHGGCVPPPFPLLGTHDQNSRFLSSKYNPKKIPVKLDSKCLDMYNFFGSTSKCLAKKGTKMVVMTSLWNAPINPQKLSVLFLIVQQLNEYAINKIWLTWGFFFFFFPLDYANSVLPFLPSRQPYWDPKCQRCQRCQRCKINPTSIIGWKLHQVMNSYIRKRSYFYGNKIKACMPNSLSIFFKSI